MSAPNAAASLWGRPGLGCSRRSPGDRRLIFVNRNEIDTRPGLPTADELGALLNARVGVDVGLHDLRLGFLFQNAYSGC